MMVEFEICIKCSSSDKEAIVSDASVLPITPVSNSSFMDSVRFRFIASVRVRLALDVPNCWAISSNVSKFSF